MEENFEFNSDEKLEYYISIGAIELAGVDTTGEFIYKITEAASEVAPELWDAHEEYVDKSLMDLYEKGLVNVSYDENLEATLELTEEGKKIAKEMGIIQMDIDDWNMPND
jgi:DNA-binding PadR family transcriptional regulator